MPRISQPTRVVSSATLDGDEGPFYTPFILDPQNSNEMIVGTCRLWRGASDGTGFNPLSNNLDTGSASTCSGNEANLVRSIAAGGPKDTGGLSQVIYAGTDGFGPLVTTTPAAGRVWVSKNSDGGPSTWADRTGIHQSTTLPHLKHCRRHFRRKRNNCLRGHHGISRASFLDDSERGYFMV